MIVYEVVPLHEIHEELQPDIARHYDEMTEGDEYGPPDIDWDNYLAASRLGRVLAFIIRDTGKLVGYSIFSIGKNPRYKTRTIAQSDGLFVEKPYRGIVSKELIKRATQHLKSVGIDDIIFILSDDRVGRLLGAHGFEANYKVWSLKNG